MYVRHPGYCGCLILFKALVGAQDLQVLSLGGDMRGCTRGAALLPR